MNCQPRIVWHVGSMCTSMSLQMSALIVACGEQKGLSGGAHPMSAWAATDRGDVFVHEPDAEQDDGKAAGM